MTLRRLFATLVAVGSVALLDGCVGAKHKDAVIDDGAVPGELLVGVRAGTVGTPGVEAVIASAGAVIRADVSGAFYRIALHAGLSRADAEGKLVHADILYVEPNYLAYGYAAPTDPDYATGWSAVFQRGLEAGWVAYGAVASPAAAKVAVLDTGVLATHEELGAGKVDAASGHNFTATGLATDVTDGNGHGTQMAGIVAAAGGNAAGGVGVASWQDGASAADPALVKVIPVKVADARNVSNHAAIANGIFHVLNGAGSPVVYTPRAQVILLSLGSASPSWTLQYAIKEAYKAGVLVVAAAGNDGTGLMRYPAAYQGAAEQVLSVASVDAFDALDSATPAATNYGTWVNLLAPGGALKAPTKDDGVAPANGAYAASLRGTSLAAAHVAGAAALLWSSYPQNKTAAHVAGELSLDELRSSLIGAVDSYDRQAGRVIATGGGRLNVASAFAVAANLAGGANGATTVYPASVTFSAISVKGGNGVTGTVALTGPAPAGGAVVSLSATTVPASILTVPATVTVPAGARTVNFAVGTKAVASDLDATASPNTGAKVTATYATRSVDGYLTVKAPGVSRLTLAAAKITDGGTVSATVTLDGPAGPGGVAITLSKTDGSGFITLPAGPTVAAGALTTSFTISRSAGHAVTDLLQEVTVTAQAASGGAAHGTLKVVPLLSAITVAPSKVKGGATAIGTLLLSGPAPTALNVSVAIGGDTAAVNLASPVTVAVASGISSKTFNIPTLAASADANPTFTASYNGYTAPVANLTVTAPAISALAVSPGVAVYFDGTNDVAPACTVTLDAPAVGATTVYLTSSDSIVAVPASITIAGGATSNAAGTCKVQPAAAVQDTAVTISASLSALGTVKKTATLTVKPVLQSFSLSPVSVAGGGSTTATVILNASVPAALTSGYDIPLSTPSARITLPASPVVTVAASRTTGTAVIATTAGPSSATAEITASVLGVSKKATLTITSPTLASISLAKASATNGDAAVTGTVTLTGPAPAGGVNVAITAASAVPGAVTVSTPAVVAAGNLSGTFTVTAGIVAADTNVTITASANSTTKSATFLVKKTPLAITSVALSTPAVLGGSPTVVTGTVTLNRALAAGAPAFLVNLASSDVSYATVPVSVSVLAGTDHIGFTVTHLVNATAKTITITATDALVPSDTGSATLVVDAAVAVASLSLNPATITPDAGRSVTGTVTVSPAAPYGGAVVNLNSADGALAAVPATVYIPWGSTTTTFAVATTAPVATDTSVALSASYGGATKLSSVTLKAPVFKPASLPAAVTLELGASAVVPVGLTGTVEAGAAAVAVPVTITAVNGSATITAGVASGNASVAAGSAATSVTVTADALLTGDETLTVGGTPVTIHVVDPATAGATVSSLTWDTTAIAPDGTATGTAILSQVVAANTAVSASSSTPAAATVAGCTVLAGSDRCTFTVTGVAAGSTTISAQVGATAAQSQLISVAAVALAGSALSPTSLTIYRSFATTASVTVTLDRPAGTASVVVTLTPASAAVTAPASLTFATGQISKSFTVTGVTAGASPVNVSAAIGAGTAQTVAVTVSN